MKIQQNAITKNINIQNALLCKTQQSNTIQHNTKQHNKPQ